MERKGIYKEVKTCMPLIEQFLSTVETAFALCPNYEKRFHTALATDTSSYSAR
jgi:hypothetical protein